MHWVMRLGVVWVLMACADAGWAIRAPDADAVAAQLFKHAELEIDERGSPVTALSGPAWRERVQRTGSAEATAMVDLRTGRFLTLLPTQPLLPGSGSGNRLPGTPPAEPAVLKRAAAAAFRSWLLEHASALAIDPAELDGEPRVTLVGADHLQLYQTRRINGVRVRDAAITATIKHGNLILFGMENWATASVRRAELDAVAAQARLQAHLDTLPVGTFWKAPTLAYVPVSVASGGFGSSTMPGLGYRLVHVLHPTLGQDGGRYEALVDAGNGTVLALQDTMHYVASPREVKGGVFPISSDGQVPDGVEQAGWPLPFTRVTTPAGMVVSDIGGNLPRCVDGNATAALTGDFVRINDTCGASSLTATGNLDFGASPGTDCTTPGVGGAGNTHAARTGFHELNMIIAMARSHLPDNAWLQQQLVANMNIQQTCNAGWNGAEVSFFRSGGGCFNTGELAGVFDHEWGHGMDDNDGVPTVSNPGEGIADLYASLRLSDSCIGRGFRSTNCSGELPGGVYACTSCTAVRDIDFAKHVGGQPFTLAMADSCGPGASAGPCGGSVHCEGQVYSQAVWDLWNRDLIGAPFNLSRNVTRELATQLTFKGASGVSNWFACTNGTGGCGNAAGCGCAATAGYMQYLAADDDNGNLSDGTPHMSAIKAAFDRHGIACTTPAVVDAGCPATPSEAPVVTLTPADGAVTLNWTASSGAVSYKVFRTDGVRGCDFGKILLGTVTGTTFRDIGLQNGRTYHYMVVPTGSNPACFSVASACSSVVPAAAGRLSVDTAAATITVPTGDGDPFIDNCESARVAIPVENTGISALTNVRVTAVSSPSHPTTQVLTPLPLPLSASLASCASVSAQLMVRPEGLTPGASLVFDVSFTADELAGQSQTVRVRTGSTEGDLSAAGTQSFNFDSSTQGWITTQGTFDRANVDGGASGTSHYLRSSAALNGACDTVESPTLVLAADSTLSLQTRFDTEPFGGGQWWDRANLSAVTQANGNATLLTPSGGRTYNASGVGGSCGMGSEAGWGGVANSWAESSFTANALQAPTLAGQLLKLRMRYGTDSSVAGDGLRFDQLVLTNVRLQVADAQPDVCGAVPLLRDGFEGP